MKFHCNENLFYIILQNIINVILVKFNTNTGEIIFYQIIKHLTT